MTTQPTAPGSSTERRRRPKFRALIDEMLEAIREASRRDSWTPEARARAEADLARIMESVRQQAVRDEDGDAEPM
jgi:hypothetical protein